MERLLTTAAVLSALATPAGAADMPKQLHGGWCDYEGSGGSYIEMPTGHCPDGPTLKITRSGFAFPDVGGTCTPVKVRKTNQGDWPAANLTIGARCAGTPTITTFEFNWWRGSLNVIEAGQD